MKNLIKFDLERYTSIVEALEIPDSLMLELLDNGTTGFAVFTLYQNDPVHLIKYLAFGLPIREAIWWAYVCMTSLFTDEEINHPLCQIIASWVQDPSEQQRQLAVSYLADKDITDAGDWLVQSIVWTGTDVVDSEGQYTLEPTEFMPQEAVYNSLSLSLMHDDQQLESYIQRGLHIAMGGNGKIS